MARKMVEEDTDWLDGMIHAAITEDNNLPDRCFDIAKGWYNSTFCILRCFVFGDSRGTSVVTYVCSGFKNQQSTIKIE